VLVILYINGINAEKLSERRRIRAEINQVFFGRKIMLTGANKQQQHITNFAIDMIRSYFSTGTIA
jgi:hypothetical protein